MASEIPLCFGTAQHSNTSLICKRCTFEYKCYLAWEKQKNETNEDQNEHSVVYNPDSENMIMTGFLAQEVETAALECNYDFSGIDKPKNVNDHYSLRYAEFVVPLVKAVQEQQEMIEEQQKEIDKLKEQNSKINELEKQIQELKDLIQNN